MEVSDSIKVSSVRASSESLLHETCEASWSLAGEARARRLGHYYRIRASDSFEHSCKHLIALVFEVLRYE